MTDAPFVQMPSIFQQKMRIIRDFLGHSSISNTPWLKNSQKMNLPRVFLKMFLIFNYEPLLNPFQILKNSSKRNSSPSKAKANEWPFHSALEIPSQLTFSSFLSTFFTNFNSFSIWKEMKMIKNFREKNVFHAIT